MNDFSQTETLNLATSTDERAIKYLRELVKEGEESGKSLPFDAKKIKMNGRKKLQAFHALQNNNVTPQPVFMILEHFS